MNQFKRAQVVMLPTNEKPIKGQILRRHIWKEDPKLECDSLWLYNNTVTIDNLKQYTTLNSSFTDWYKAFEPQHLYIISDDEIKEDDWFIGDNISIKQCTLNNGGNINFKGGWYSGSTNCKKIIATTDTSLNYETPFYGMDADNNFPTPSQQFITKYIEEYNKGNIIADVLVEYKRVFETVAKGMIGHPEDDISWWNEKLKINPNDNTITIKKLKDSWNREEYAADVKRLCNLLYFSSNRDVDFNTKEELDNWIDQNL